MKACSQCKFFKPHDEFYSHPKMRDGHVGKCKECTKAGVRANYAANVEKYNEYDRNRSMQPHRVRSRLDYRATENGKVAVSRAQKKYNRSPLKKNAIRRYRDRYPSKRIAHVKCGNAIRHGKLIRQPCEVCGETKAQAHHDDYSKPLDVRWLCTKHHSEWHRHNTPIYPEKGFAA